jgi:hypothetical protein
VGGGCLPCPRATISDVLCLIRIGSPPFRSHPRWQVGVYTSAARPYARTALFPHGAQKKPIGVVSDRAIK